jgi:anaerobic magnesium-protoporphyrin IX monomethyl ester cyclase
MARVMLCQPWNFHDENFVHQDLVNEWRCAPYSLVMLGTLLRSKGHTVSVIDLIERLVTNRGDLDLTLEQFAAEIRRFSPDILGVGFFSIHYVEVKRLVQFARAICAKAGLQTTFIAGGIHASTEPILTLENLDFDYVFVGEAEISLAKFCDGDDPSGIEGVVGRSQRSNRLRMVDTKASGPAKLGTLIYPHKGEVLHDLDSIPFPDYSLVNYRFYAQPNRSKFRAFIASSLDMIMGRGCVYRCSFCAYNALSTVRFHSAEYLVEQLECFVRSFGIDSFYFMDSTIGNNQPLLHQISDLMQRRGHHRRIKWNGCMRPNQINRKLLTTLTRGGCCHLLYGFESNSERVLQLMHKDCHVEDNEETATLHREMDAPYTASMLMGFPGEREEDILRSIDFVRRHKPPIAAFNWYIPLPGSPDYDALRANGLIDRDDPMEWRKIGEVASQARIFCDVPRDRFTELFNYGQTLCNKLTHDYGVWGCIAPHGSEIDIPVPAPVPAAELQSQLL